MLSYLSSVILIFLLPTSEQASTYPAFSPQYVSVKSFKCVPLECNITASILVPQAPPYEVGLSVELIPNELTLKGSVSVDGENIYNGQLDPSLAPVCLPPLPSVCLVINHVDLRKKQICTKFSLLFLTLQRLPCIGVEDGRLRVRFNTFP